MHAIMELQDDAEQCVRAAKAPDDREKNNLLTKAESFGQVYECHV